LPRKHWNDQPQRLADPDYEVQLWAAGRIAAADAALMLLEGRARRADTEFRRWSATEGVSYSAPWPELAESNCFACHQPLRGQFGRVSLDAPNAGRYGVPRWESWNLALISVVAPARALAATELALPGGTLDGALKRLRSAMENSLAADPAEVAKLAEAAGAALRRQAWLDSFGRVFGRDRALGAEAALSSAVSTEASATWDELCQELAAFVAVERALVDRGTLDENWRRDVHRRIGRVAAALRFESADIEWPAVFADSKSMSLADAGRELATVRAMLLRAATSSGGEASR